MMIDNAIFKIYQQDKKVFIPDFGAIIYSEFSDTIDFNPHLNFDDGKIVTEIQKQESISEEEAKSELEEYIINLNANLDAKGTFYLGGIGYFSKGEDGTITVAASMSEPVFINDEGMDSGGIEEKEMEEESENSDALNAAEDDSLSDELEDGNDEISMAQEERGVDEEIMLKEEVFTANEQDAMDDLHNSPGELESIDESDNEEESVEPEYLYQADEVDSPHFEEADELSDKKRSSILIALVAILALAILAVPLYLFVLRPTGTDEVRVQESTMPANEINANIDPEQSNREGDNIKKESELSTEELEKPKTILTASSAESSESARSSQKTYSLILGSFKVENNADNFELHLNQKGMDVNKFHRGGSFYFVGIEQIQGKSKAVEMLVRLRKEEEPTAWIIRKK